MYRKIRPSGSEPTILYVMLCYVMLCYVMLCYVMLCLLNEPRGTSYINSVRKYPGHEKAKKKKKSHTYMAYEKIQDIHSKMLCRHKDKRGTQLPNNILYVMLCYVMLCCVMLCYVMPIK